MTYRDFLLLAPPLAVLCMALAGLAWFVYLIWRDRQS